MSGLFIGLMLAAYIPDSTVYRAGALVLACMMLAAFASWRWADRAWRYILSVIHFFS